MLQWYEDHQTKSIKFTGEIPVSSVVSLELNKFDRSMMNVPVESANEFLRVAEMLFRNYQNQQRM